MEQSSGRIFLLNGLVTCLVLLSVWFFLLPSIIPSAQEDWGGGTALTYLFYYGVTTLVVAAIEGVIMYGRMRIWKYPLLNGVFTLGVAGLILMEVFVFGVMRTDSAIRNGYQSCLEFVKEANVSQPGSMTAASCEGYKH